MKILITGSTGYLGKKLTEVLAGRGYNVRAVARDPKNVSFENPAEIVRADMLEPHTLNKALEGATHLIHCAAFVKVWSSDKTLFDRINVSGFSNLLRYAAERKIKQIIYVSTFLALGPTGEAAANEETSYPADYRPRTDYERTKYIAEAIARHQLKLGAPMTVVYPGVIYGPGKLTEGNLVGKILADFFKRKIPLMIGRGNRKWPFSYIDDVVAGVLSVLEKDIKGERFILGGENRTLGDLFRTVRALTGKRMPFRVPYTMAELAGFYQWARAELFGKEPEFTHHIADIFRRDWVYGSEKAKKYLGYSVTPFEEGVKKTLLWLKEEQGVKIKNIR